MAGILPGIALINNFDNNGDLMRGALLRIYQAGTTTPVTAFKDSGLTPGQEHPWPIPADSAARLPMFYLDDGDYRVRLSSDDGSYVAYDIPFLSAVGPSSGGGGGGGGGVSPEVLFNTGDVLWLPRSGLRDGWVRHNGRTIGNATSSATERANADTQALFEYLYSEYADTICPVIGGRGANATADFNAGKPITLLNGRFIIPIGLDDMGNTAAGRASGIPAVSGNGTTAASVLGETRHVSTQAELPAIKPPITISDPGHQHDVPNTMKPTSDGAGGGSTILVWTPGTSTSNIAGTNITAAFTNNLGSGQAHNNTPLVMTGTYYVKL